MINVEFIIRYVITTWFGNISVKFRSNQNLIKKIGKTSVKWENK